MKLEARYEEEEKKEVKKNSKYHYSQAHSIELISEMRNKITLY